MEDKEKIENKMNDNNQVPNEVTGQDKQEVAGQDKQEVTGQDKQEATGQDKQEVTGQDEQQVSAGQEPKPESTLEEQLAEQKDKFLRLFAEFDNYKKRVSKERIELFSSAAKDTILDFLPLMDDFERAIKSNENSEDLAAIKEGLTLIYDKMAKTFEKKGVKKIEAKGTKFDADIHEAITEVSVSEDMKGMVIEEVECGYMLNDKIIRYSKVVVGK